MENNSVTRALGIAIYGEISPILVTLTGSYFLHDDHHRQRDFQPVTEEERLASEADPRLVSSATSAASLARTSPSRQSRRQPEAAGLTAGWAGWGAWPLSTGAGLGKRMRMERGRRRRATCTSIGTLIGLLSFGLPEWLKINSNVKVSF